MSKNDADNSHKSAIERIRTQTVELVDLPEKLDRGAESYADNERYAYWGRPGSTVRSVKHGPTGKLIFDVTYGFDERGRRLTPPAPHRASAPSRFAVFFGEAPAFGEGVADAETLPAHFEALHPTYRAYNYGFIGHGPQQMLLRLQDESLVAELGERGGVFMYSLRDCSVPIAAGRLPWCGGFPRFELTKSGSLVQDGFFPRDAARKWMLPAEYREEDIELFLKIILESQRAVAERFPGSSFYVVAHPITTLAHVLVPRLHSLGIGIIDLSTYDLEFNSFYQGRLHDGNHAGPGNKLLALEVGRALAGRRTPGPSPYLLTEAPRSPSDFRPTLFNRAFQIPHHSIFPFDDGADLVFRTLNEFGLSFGDTGEFSLQSLLEFAEGALKYKKRLVSACEHLGLVGRGEKGLSFEEISQVLFTDTQLWPVNQRYFYEEYFMVLERRYRGSNTPSDSPLDSNKKP